MVAATFLYVESDVPPGMTLAEFRRSRVQPRTGPAAWLRRSQRRRRQRRRALALALIAEPCGTPR